MANGIIKNKRAQSVTEYCIFFAAVAMVLVLAFQLNGPFYRAIENLFSGPDGLVQNIEEGLSPIQLP